ncbi:4-alpha-N-acetylgalactosaminyltransferase [compost metagenome]
MSKGKREYKIALVGDCLAGGGAEKVHAILSVFFESKGFSVHNIILIDEVTYTYSGVLFNLGKLKTTTIYDKLKRVYLLRNYFIKNDFDFIIDFRYRVNTINELLIAHFAYNLPAIYTVHSGIIDFYIPKRTRIAKLIYSKHQFVTVSKAIEKAIQQKLNIPVNTINNPFEIDKVKELSNQFMPQEEKFIVAVGRMNDKVKQFDKLILAYADSILPRQKIKLLIIGSGQYLDELIELVEQKNLGNDVIFKGYQNNPHVYQKNALFSVISSVNEGFPNVIVESLITGTPVVSFDCFSGPNEIIIDKYNGLLVEDQNVSKLTEALNTMVTDKDLYLHCKNNATISAEPFSVDVIGNQWLRFLKINY